MIRKKERSYGGERNDERQHKKKKERICLESEMKNSVNVEIQILISREKERIH